MLTLTTKGTAPLATAISDPWLFNSNQEETAFAKTRAAGASYVRLNLSWSAIAPGTRPNGFVATDPTSPGYSWGTPTQSWKSRSRRIDADPRHQRHPELGISEEATRRQRRDAENRRPRAVRDGARHALRRQRAGNVRPRSAGRPRLPGLERGQQQPFPRPGQRDQLPRNGQRSRNVRACRRPEERRHRRRPRSVRAPQGQEAEVELAGAARLHALAALPLQGIPSAQDLQRDDPLRRLVASPVHLQRTLRTREESRRHLARRPPEDAGAAAGGHQAPSRRLAACGQVLGDGVQLGHKPATPPCRAQRARGTLDGRGLLPDVAVRRLARDLVRLAGSRWLEPVPEWPLPPLRSRWTRRRPSLG